MPSFWDRFRSHPPQPDPSAEPEAVTAAATVVRSAGERVTIQPEHWQTEVWGFYDELGEFRFGVNWLAEAMSRVRLTAAKRIPGQDEPEPAKSGPAVDLVAELGGDTGGQAALMSRFAQLLTLPGESYLLGETEGRVHRWAVKSTGEIRPKGSHRRGGQIEQSYEVLDEERTRPGQEIWRPVAEDHLLGRVWRPHPRLGYLADSPARAARPTMRELELVNRKIQAQYLSRLASAGIVVFPEEVTFPIREEFADAADPLVSEWIEIAKEAIATPGSAAAVVPIPMRMPGEWIQHVKFIDFSTQLDDHIIEKRDSAIKRLASQLDMPAEVLLGMGDVNHWSAWQLEESGIKLHISPLAELIVGGLTRIYLHPRLKALGEDPAEWVVWYDTSELTQRPDRSENAVQVYDRLEMSGEAFRREMGFDEADKPNEKDLAELVKLRAAREAGTLPRMLEELAGIEPSEPVVPPSGQNPDDTGEDDRRADGPPDTRDESPPGPQDARAASARPLEATTVAGHSLVIDHGGGWRLLHPGDCSGKGFTCPVTWHAFAHAVAPGTPGRYLLGVAGGRLTLGERVLNGEPADAVLSRVR